MENIALYRLLLYKIMTNSIYGNIICGYVCDMVKKVVYFVEF